MDIIKFDLGERVYFQRGANAPKTYGSIKWIGTLPGRGEDLGVLAGIECDEALGQGSGMYKKIRYFMAKEGHAAFVPLSHLIREGEEEPPIVQNHINNNNNNFRNDFNQNGVERDEGFEGDAVPEFYARDVAGRGLGAIGAPVPIPTMPSFHPPPPFPRFYHARPPFPQHMPQAMIPQQSYPQVPRMQQPPQQQQQPIQLSYTGGQFAEAPVDSSSSGDDREVEEEEEEEVEDEEEEFFESDEDLEEQLNVDISDVERRLQQFLLRKNAEVPNPITPPMTRAVETSSPAAPEVDGVAVPVKESSDQWSKVASELKKAPTQVQEKLAVEKAPVLVPKKKEKTPVFNEDLAKNNPKYKKMLCHFYEKLGKCNNGDKCLYAHGEKELRVDVKPKFVIKKTILCQFHLAGGCRHGDNCTFAHGKDELNTPRVKDK